MRKTIIKIALLIIFACVCSIIIYYQAAPENTKQNGLFEISYSK